MIPLPQEGPSCSTHPKSNRGLGIAEWCDDLGKKDFGSSDDDESEFLEEGTGSDFEYFA